MTANSGLGTLAIARNPKAGQIAFSIRLAFAFPRVLGLPLADAEAQANKGIHCLHCWRCYGYMGPNHFKLQDGAADRARSPYQVLKKVSSRIVNEIRGTNHVLYDITPKPLGTIEWKGAVCPPKTSQSRKSRMFSSGRLPRVHDSGSAARFSWECRFG
jgi:hypothetical protein